MFDARQRYSTSLVCLRREALEIGRTVHDAAARHRSEQDDVSTPPSPNIAGSCAIPACPDVEPPLTSPCVAPDGDLILRSHERAYAELGLEANGVLSCAGCPKTMEPPVSISPMSSHRRHSAGQRIVILSERSIRRSGGPSNSRARGARGEAPRSEDEGSRAAAAVALSVGTARDPSTPAARAASAQTLLCCQEGFLTPSPGPPCPARWHGRLRGRCSA